MPGPCVKILPGPGRIFYQGEAFLLKSKIFKCEFRSFMGNISLGPTSHLNLDKVSIDGFPIANQQNSHNIGLLAWARFYVSSITASWHILNWNNFIGEVNLGQSSCLNLNKLGVYWKSDVPNRQSTLFT